MATSEMTDVLKIASDVLSTQGNTHKVWIVTHPITKHPAGVFLNKQVAEDYKKCFVDKEYHYLFTKAVIFSTTLYLEVEKE